MAVALEPGWLQVLNKEFEKDYMISLRAFLQSEKQQGFLVYPQNANIFNALNLTPFEKVKVVILGQDPYHGINQAHGLSFSVQKGIAPPPSLKNIFQELKSDIFDFRNPAHGDLTSWAKQGVLLLNATLTVRAASPGSHQNQGWEMFTDEIIKSLSDQKDHLVFMLWGNYARKKGELIDATKHAVLTAAHPSPFSAYSGFFGSGHFSKANEFLKNHGLDPIDWNVE